MPKKQVRVILVQFDSTDSVLINVRRGVTLDDGSLIEQEFENVHATQTDLGARAVARGATVDAWGNADVSAIVQAETVEVSPAVDAVAEVRDANGAVLTPAVTAVAAVRAPRFPNATVVF